MSDLHKRAEKRVDRKISFYRNFSAYIIVNAMLLVINWYFTPEFWWVAFILFFWGIGVVKDFIMAFVFISKFDSESYRQQKIEEEMEKLRN